MIEHDLIRISFIYLYLHPALIDLSEALQKAISVAPRGKRAMELLEIRVGTQTISPFYWALESGSLLSAKAHER